ncbi:exodeoxyribonuclease VII large subunit [Pedobacter frigoris]|uniref:Exodeoxyribonuclease 7 large subunit n=1 Tax=Pedobacter frigoris TaxID=2571272 RepID=A0A4U1CPS0_9SPHI|nr:exodeoxyribonuclease VII large subunit [Pedobacter frigoris]TKC09514.1 exodeoxyribonuclease VII large subunit [Pedobacter frigoris]
MAVPSHLSNRPSISLSELTGRIRQTIDEVFGQNTFWVIADITNYTYKPQSNYHYFELVEKDKSSSKILAKIAGRAWGAAAVNITNFEQATGQKFKNDINVLIQVSVQYNPSFGLQLNLIDIDTSFTLGLFEQQRKDTLERLLRENTDFVQKQGEQYITRNSLLHLNKVIQSIAIISSDTSAGYLDFKHTLDNNAFNYKFDVDNYFTLVQGEVNAKQILAKIIEVFQAKKNYDALVIIRGGGSQMDFLIFDNYELSRAIARFPIPVITGIGHQKNETIADLMAHTSTKTPTKAAELIIAHNRAFEEQILNIQKVVVIKVFQMINLQKDRLAHINHLTVNTTKELLYKYHKNIISLSAAILTNPKIIISNRKKDLSNLGNNIQSYSRIYFANKMGYLGHFISMIKLMSPQNILNKGFAIIKVDGKIVSNANDIETGTKLSVQFTNTEINTVVTDKKAYNGSEFNL